MKKLNKKRSIYNSIEAYACSCGNCSCGCGCTCTPIAEYNSSYVAVSNGRASSNISGVSSYNNNFNMKY